MPVRDVIVAHPRILLVGINPGLRSEQTGHHFAGPGNPFWRLIHRAGLVGAPLTAEEDQRLGEFGIALTNLCRRSTRAASELSRDEMRKGRAAVERKAGKLRPRAVAFVGLTVYQQFFGLAKSGGPGEKPESIAGARVFVVPNPSGLNASFPSFASKLEWFERLREFTSSLER